MDILARAIAGRAAHDFASAEDFWAWHVEDAAKLDRPVDRAIAGGTAVDRLGFAFAAGYGAALQALLPSLGPRTLASLAATEEGGAHPRAIRTALVREAEGWRLSGHKRWVTLAGTEVLVLARQGESSDGRPRLVVVRVPRHREGMRIVPMPPLAFVPEIPHAEIVLDRVPIDEADLLPGDGWEDWVKPFRTVEDVHVHAALLGFLLSTGARAGWPHPIRERMASLLVGIRTLADAPASSPAVHLALAGAISGTHALIEESASLWASVPEPARLAWERDRALLEVAGKARAARTERAWERIAP